MRTLVVVAAVGALVGGAAMRPVTPVAAAGRAPAVTVGAAVDSALLAEGKALVGSVCSTCHTVQPPLKAAPPLSHVARHYVDRYGRDSAVAAIARWIPAPTRERSALPSMAIERWGVMPALPLAGRQLQAAATYVASLAADGEAHPDSTAAMPRRNGMGMGMGGMMMHRMRHGQGTDTSAKAPVHRHQP
jgi:mono/diheme cytochrome c family protein